MKSSQILYSIEVVYHCIHCWEIICESTFPCWLMLWIPFPFISDGLFKLQITNWRLFRMPIHVKVKYFLGFSYFHCQSKSIECFLLYSQLSVWLIENVKLSICVVSLPCHSFGVLCIQGFNVFLWQSLSMLVGEIEVTF